MRKIRAAINMTLDGFCNHDAVTPDEQVHQHYTELLRSADAILYGRITFELMKYWQTFIQNPSGTPEFNEFAQVIDSLPKIVFSRTLSYVGWHSATLSAQTLEQEAEMLRRQPGRDILVGSRSLVMQLIDLHLLDELELLVHPVIAGSGLPLFAPLTRRREPTLFDSRRIGEGAVILRYGFMS